MSPILRPIFVVVFLVFALVFAVTRCRTAEGELKQKSEYNAALIKHVSKQGDTIAEQRQQLFTDQSDLNNHIAPVEGLKDVQAQVHAKTRVEIRNVYVPIEKPVYYRDSTGSYLKTPARFSLNDKWYSLTGVVTDSSVLRIERLSVLDEPTITLGYRRLGWKGLFKKDEPIVTYSSKNPYISLTSMENFVLAPPPAKRFGVGVQLGFGFSQSLSPSPYVGIGIQYSLIRF